MAASGYTPISLYYSTTASAVPTAGNLANGELALNIADMKLYAKNSSGVVTLLASNASTTGVDSLSFGSTGLTPSTATTGAITVAGTLNVANGGTGLTSLTANRIPYGNGTSAFQSSSSLIFDGTNLVVGSSTAYEAMTVWGNSAIVNSSYRGSSAGSYLTFRTGGDATERANPVAAVRGIDQYGAAGATGFSGSLLLYYQTANALVEGARLNYLGYFGIGNTTPASTLAIGSGAGSGGYNGGVYLNRGASTYNFYEANDGTNSVIFGLDNTISHAKIGTVNSYPVGFYTGNSNRFLIGTAGQLGIGGANYGTSGQVLTSGGSGAAPTWTTPASGGGSFTAKTTNYTAASGDNILADTSSASWTLTLPASPTTGNSVQVMDSKGSFGQYPLTVARNGSTIMSASEDMTLAVNGAATTFVYNGSTWRVI